MTDEPTVREGDTVLFTRDDTEMEVTNVYDDGSFFLEHHDEQGRHVQIFSSSLFTRDGRFVEHIPGDRVEQETIADF